MSVYNPTHPGAIIRDGMMASGWTVAACASRMEVARNTLSRLLSEQTRISPAMALGLERLGWGTADFWVLLQAAHDLAQERLRREAMEERKAKKPVRRKVARRAVVSRRRPARSARHRATG